MIVLHHSIGARSFRPLWMLEEMGLTYDLRIEPFPPRVFRKPYLGTNPLGTIPYMIDGETEMTESAAICEYLAARHGPTPLGVSVTEKDFGRYLNFLDFGEATLTFPQAIIVRYTRVEPPERRLTQAVDDYRKFTAGRLRGLSQFLGEREFIAADRFTAADISVGYALHLAEILGINEDFPPNVAAYWARLKGRPGFARACAVETKAAADQGVGQSAV